MMYGMHMERITLRESLSDRRTFLLTAVVASIAGCSDENKAKVQSALTSKESSGERWKRFAAIAEQLEQRGNTVRWNHPPEGPTNPIFIVPNNHVGQFAEGVGDERQALTILSEYRSLRFLVDQAGMKRVACEGVPADSRFPRPRLYESKKPNGQMDLSVVKNPASSGPPGAKPLSATEIRELFSNEQDALRFIRTVPQLKSIAADMASAGTDDSSVEFGGAEDPKEIAFMKQFVLSRRDDLLLYDRYRAAVAQKIAGGKKLDFQYATGQNGIRVIRIGSEEFDTMELKRAILVSLGETDEDKELSARREAFIANRLRTDVVHFGNGHAEQFLEMKTTRSLGVILSEAAKRNMESRKDRTDLQRGTLDAIEKIERSLQKE